MKTTVLQVTSSPITDIKDSHKQVYPENRTPITPVQKAIRELIARSYDADSIQHTLSDILVSCATITLQWAIIRSQQAIIWTQERCLRMLRDKVAIARGETPEVSVDKEEPQVLLSKEVLQPLRDEVRYMVAKSTPKENIPLYRGKDPDGVAIDFFKNHYAQYIVPRNEVIFAKDLVNIDDKLLRAMRNEARNGGVMPIGTVSDLTNALVNERFEDGKNTWNRIQNARARAEARWGYAKKN